MTVNGEARACDTKGSESLLFALREYLHLTGSKGACEQGECGSCSVLLDGELVCSCLVMAVDAHGSEVVTVEGAGRARTPPGSEGADRCRRGPVRILHARFRRGRRRTTR